MKLLTAIQFALASAAAHASSTTHAQSSAPVKIDGLGFKVLDFNGKTLCGIDKGDLLHCTPYDPVKSPNAKLKWSQKGSGSSEGGVSSQISGYPQAAPGDELD